MTDLRDLDRRAARLAGWRKGWVSYNTSGKNIRVVGYKNHDGNFYARTPKYSSDPDAANLLIEDLQKRGIEWSLVCENAEDPYTIWNNTTPDIYGATWMEAVTRFYVAVREAQE